MEENQSRSSVRSRKVSLRTIILATLTIISFYAIATKNGTYYEVMPAGRGYSTSGSVAPSMPVSVPEPMIDSAIARDGFVEESVAYGRGGGGVSGMAPDYYPYPSGEVSIKDNRELQKTYYSVSMFVRDVSKMIKRIEAIVRSHDGRIDTMSISEKSGYLSFVVSADTYDSLRAQLEGLVDSRFISVNISTSNLLPQKVSIEDQQKQASSTIADYQASRKKLVQSHGSVVASLQSQIDQATNQISLLRAQSQTPDIQYQIQRLTDEWSSLKQQLVNENTSYQSQLDSIDSTISYTKERQKLLSEQDTKLMDSVETVSGTVSVQWIRLWDMIQKYLPGYSIPAIFALLTMVSFWWDRRRTGAV